jgi:hypothetical protein
MAAQAQRIVLSPRLQWYALVVHFPDVAKLIPYASDDDASRVLREDHQRPEHAGEASPKSYMV